MTIFNTSSFGWHQLTGMLPWKYRCASCGSIVSSILGYRVGHHSDGRGGQVGGIYICPHCASPTFLNVDGRRFPEERLGSDVGHLPEEVKALYDEARSCTGCGSYTAAVMMCRKILMHIAVEQGAEKGESFVEYVQFLADKGYVPPNGKLWVDHIRQKGNEANHEIVVMKKEDAVDLVQFLEMLLRFVYEFPQSVPQPRPSKKE